MSTPRSRIAFYVALVSTLGLATLFSLSAYLPPASADPVGNLLCAAE